MRQLTVVTIFVRAGEVSKLPMRQLTYEGQSNSFCTISKLPMRQLTYYGTIYMSIKLSKLPMRQLTSDL